MKLRLLLLVALCLATALAQEEPPPEPPNPCEGLSGSFVNDPSSCRGYFFCVNGNSIPGSCQEGFFFNEAEQLCDFEANVPCVDCPPTGIHLISVPGSCTEYFVSHLFRFGLKFFDFCLPLSSASMEFLSNRSVLKVCTLTQQPAHVTFVKMSTARSRCVRSMHRVWSSYPVSRTVASITSVRTENRFSKHVKPVCTSIRRPISVICPKMPIVM
jgi:Chitin binding Peritrophin-A domain